jgi:Flp pilus assembly protein TadG
LGPRKLIAKLKQLHARAAREERANGVLVASLLMIPLVCGLFGFGVDFTLGHYARQAIQRDLDQATQSALSQLTNPGTDNNTNSYPVYSNPNDPDPECRSYSASRWLQCKSLVLYKLERTNIPLRSCYNDADSQSTWEQVGTDDGCRFFMIGSPTLTNSGGTGYKHTYTFTITVREQINYTFLQIFGIPTQDIQVTSTATTSSAYLPAS